MTYPTAQDVLKLAMDVAGIKEADGQFQKLYAVRNLLSSPLLRDVERSLLDLEVAREMATKAARQQIAEAGKAYSKGYAELVARLSMSM